MTTGREAFMIRKLFRNAVLTMILAELFNALAAVIDGIVTGRALGATALAACGIGAPYFSVVSVISGVLMVGATAMSTRAVGKGDTAETTRVFSLTMLLGTSLSVLLALSGLFFSGGYATLFGARDAASELHAETSAYLRGVFIGAPGFTLFVILVPFLQMDGDPVRPKLAGVALAVTDVAGDLLNVYVFRGGMFGMGLATAAGQYAALAVVLTHFVKKSALFRFSLREVRLRMTFSLIRDGVPRGVCMLCRGLLPVLLNNLALSLAGDGGVAAYSVLLNTIFVVAAAGWGIGGAVFLVGGMCAGEQDPGGLGEVVRGAGRAILILVVPIAVLVAVLAPQIARIFIPDGGDAASMAATALRCLAATLPFLAFNVAAANCAQAIGRDRRADILNIMIELGGTAAMALLLRLWFGIDGIWYAFPAGAALLSAAIVLAAVLAPDRKREGLMRYLSLPADFGVPEEDCLERSPHSEEEVVTLSEDVLSFCAARGIPPKEANRLALCVEEMAGNVIEHGFADGTAHHLEVRVLIKEGQVTLRMRDDCAAFDLREQAKKWTFDPEHPERNIGVRMVMHAAKDISYTRVMKTNNLIVSV